MNRVARKGLVTAMVAGGVLASAGYAQADSAADGETAGSPGVLSGNSIQAPIDIPVNVCGNTINVIGLLNPTMGNRCANTSAGSVTSAPAVHTLPAPLGSVPSTGARPARHAGSAAVETGPRAGSSRTGGGAHAASGTTGSPGVLSGNSLALPIDLPVNLSGNSVNVVGIGNPSFGNTAVNGDAPQPDPTTPAPPAHQPVPAPPNTVAPPTVVSPVAQAPSLAHTGADGLGWSAAGSAGLLLGGAVLYRRFRPGRG
ncbi:MAG: hypothetical protein QOF98_904 [Streptomyces sp.]|jgi:hypothetical protein|nr:hypothetical protein [Streptomyces sp.]